MIKFTHIEQLNNVLKKMRKCPPDGPVTFSGTVKLHGTNAGVAFLKDGVKFQSRTRYITPEDDNYGFAAFATDKLYALELFARYTRALHTLPEDAEVILFGEWIGPGINKGCVIHTFPLRQFVIFSAVHVLGEDEYVALPALPHWEPNSKSRQIFSVTTAQAYTITIDPLSEASRMQARDKLAELTLQVEDECPWGKLFGLSGIGEGIVWVPTGEHSGKTEWYFKTKGNKHKGKAEKVHIPVDVEAVASARAFADEMVDEARLEQGLEALKEQGLVLEMRSLGPYLKWVGGDVQREGADKLEASGLTWKKAAKYVSIKAKEHFLVQLRGVDG